MIDLCKCQYDIICYTHQTYYQTKEEKAILNQIIGSHIQL